jgi:hypothetical protein
VPLEPRTLRQGGWKGLPPWLVTFPISSIAFICYDICLLLAVMTSRLTIGCLILDAMALAPNEVHLVQPFLFVHMVLYFLH